MKDIHEVPTTLNHVPCRGEAARARSVHSMDRKLGRKGGARTRPQQLHPEAHSPRNFNRPPEAHQKSTMQHRLKAHMTSMTFHQTPTKTTQPTSCVQVHLYTFNNLSHTESLSSSQTVPAFHLGPPRIGRPLPGQ